MQPEIAALPGASGAHTLLDYAQLDEANIALQLSNIDLNEFIPQLLSAHTYANIQLQWKPAEPKQQSRHLSGNK